MALHAHVQRFDALQEQERVEGADARADIAQPFDAGFDDEAMFRNVSQKFMPW